MTKKAFLPIAAVVLGFGVSSTQAAQLLLNGSFETPVVAAGTTQTPNPGLGTLPTSWTVENATAAVDPTVSNLTHGVVTNGTGNDGTHNLPLDPYDAGSAQSLDISGDGYLYQNITSMYTAPVTIKIDFGGRDSGSGSGSGSFWSIYDSTGTTLLATSSGSAINPTFGAWSTQTLSTTISLTANVQYRFVVTLANPDQVDGISITQVPEPTTLAAAGLGMGLLGWIGFQRRRRS